jgi:hypothetical protein
MLLIIKALFVYLGSIAGFFLLGTFLLWICRVKSANFYFRTFLSIFLGLCISVILYSLIRTRFLSSHIPLLVLVAYVLYVHIFRKADRFPKSELPMGVGKKAYMKGFLFSVSVGIVIFLLTVIAYIDSEALLRYPIGDHIVYSKMSVSNDISANENGAMVLNVLYPEEFRGLFKYHYFELWLNALISRIFDFSAMVTLILVVFPLFAFLFFLGILSLWEHYTPIKSIHIALSFFMLFVGGVFYQFYDKELLLDSHQHFSSSGVLSFWGKKMGVVYIFAALALNLFIRGRKELSFLVFAMLPVLYMSTLPGIWGFLILFIAGFFLFGYGKTLRRMEFFLFFAGTLILYFVLYALYPSPSNQNYLPSYTETNRILLALNGKQSLLTAMKSTIWSFLKYLTDFLYAYSLYALIIIPALLFLKNKEKRNTLLLVLLAGVLPVLIGILFASIHNMKYNLEQFVWNLFPVLNLAIIYLLIVVLGENPIYGKRNYYFLFVLFLGIFMNVYSMYIRHKNLPRQDIIETRTYASRILDFMSDVPKRELIAFASAERMPNQFLTPYIPTLLLQGYENTINLNNPFTLDTIQYKKTWHLNPFELYIRSEEYGSFSSMEEVRIVFMKKNKIRILVSNDTMINNSVQPFIIDQIRASHAGQMIMKLQW